MIERSQAHPDAFRPREASLNPPELLAQLQSATDIAFDLDDTLITHNALEAQIRVAWFVTYDTIEGLDPKTYCTVDRTSPAWDDVMAMIKKASLLRYDDPDYLLTVTGGWGNAFRTDSEREQVITRGLGYDKETFWKTYTQFRADTRAYSSGDLGVTDGAIPLLDSLHTAGKKVHIVSNSSATTIQQYVDLLQQAGNSNEFTHTISTIANGHAFRKPHPESMQQLVQELRRETREGPITVAYVGNSLEDMQFAHAANTSFDQQGLPVSVVPVLITRGQDYADIPLPTHCRFSDLSQLQAFLQTQPAGQ